MSYDELPYTEHAYAEAHPDRLAVVALLSGWSRAPDVATARVLEIGCGRGGNLLPMAAGAPGASFVGVDPSTAQIEHARTIARDAGLVNVRFVDTGFEDAALESRAFDYVVAHGVWSWITPPARRAMLATMARCLAPGGLAYVSFNVLPGWYDRLAARDWLRFAGATLGDGARDASRSLAWLRDRVSPEKRGYRERLEEVGRRLDATDPAYAAHEYLAPEHHPELVTTFLAEAGAAGLAYLGDAVPEDTALELAPPELVARAEPLGVAEVQQLVDFARAASFRRAVLVREVDRAARGWTWPRALDPRALGSLRLASRLRPHGGAELERFDAPDVSVQVADVATRRALHRLAAAWPRSLAFSELTELAQTGDRAALASELFDVWLATSALDLHVHEPPLVATASERPAACPVARWHAAHGGPLTSRWHHEIVLAEPIVRWVLERCDGTRTLRDLARDAVRALGAGQGALVGPSVELLAASALLVA